MYFRILVALKAGEGGSRVFNFLTRHGQWHSLLGYYYWLTSGDVLNSFLRGYWYPTTVYCLCSEENMDSQTEPFCKARGALSRCGLGSLSPLDFRSACRFWFASRTILRKIANTPRLRWLRNCPIRAARGSHTTVFHSAGDAETSTIRMLVWVST